MQVSCLGLRETQSVGVILYSDTSYVSGTCHDANTLSRSANDSHGFTDCLDFLY